MPFEALRAKLQGEFGGDADTILATHRRSRPEASAPDIYIAITTAGMFWVGALAIAERKYIQQGAPVYTYMFVHESDYGIPGTTHRFGTGHATEIPYEFDNIDLLANSGGMQIVGVNSTSAAAAHNMSEMWATFATTGHPAAKGQPEWPAYDLKSRPTMEIEAQCRVVDDPFGKERELWERLKL